MSALFRESIAIQSQQDPYLALGRNEGRTSQGEEKDSCRYSQEDSSSPTRVFRQMP